MGIPAQRDLEASRVALVDWLKTKLPGADGITVTDLQAPGGTGFSNETLLCDASWTTTEGACERGLVLRLQAQGYQIFPDVDVLRQERVLRALWDHTDVPVPEPLWREDDASVLGSPFFVMAKVDGRIPSDIPPYNQDGWLHEVPVAERHALWASGVDQLVRIHAVDWKAAGLGFLESQEEGATPFDQHLAYMGGYLEWAARGKPQPVAERAWAWLRENKPEFDETVLSWGDARIGNQVFDGTRCAAVLDWEMARLGSPMEDLAWWLFLDRYHAEGSGLTRLDGLGSRDETIARYEELSGRTVHDLHYYEVFAGFRFAVVMMRVAQMVVEYGLAPADSDMETDNPVTRLLDQILGT